MKMGGAAPLAPRSDGTAQNHLFKNVNMFSAIFVGSIYLE